MQKETRLSIRIDPLQKEVIAQAARLNHLTISSFVLEKAYEAAQKIVADHSHFVLPKDQWEAFCEALDRPPKAIPALKKLFQEPSLFDER